MRLHPFVVTFWEQARAAAAEPSRVREVSNEIPVPVSIVLILDLVFVAIAKAVELSHVCDMATALLGLLPKAGILPKVTSALALEISQPAVIM